MAEALVEPIQSQLGILEPLSIVPAQSRAELALFDWLLWRYHYLPYSGAAGENIKYLVYDCRARPLACLLYGAAAWKLSVRDQFIGWSKQQREANLCYLANNLRFLILPWVRVKNLASVLYNSFGYTGHPPSAAQGNDSGDALLCRKVSTIRDCKAEGTCGSPPARCRSLYVGSPEPET